MLVDIATNKSIAVFVPGDVLTITNDTRIQPGAKVSVRGIVEEYQGEVNIVLRNGSNLKARARGNCSSLYTSLQSSRGYTVA